MRRVLQVLALLLFVTALALPLSISSSVKSQSATEALTTDMDAKTDDLFNGFGALGTPIDECVAEPVPPEERGAGRFEDNKFIFSERETVADGLGPTYNDVGCVTCHQAVDTGAFGQQMEFRAGHVSNGNFVDAPGGPREPPPVRTERHLAYPRAAVLQRGDRRPCLDVPDGDAVHLAGHGEARSVRAEGDRRHRVAMASEGDRPREQVATARFVVFGDVFGADRGELFERFRDRPALILCGENDALTPRVDHEDMARIAPLSCVSLATMLRPT